MSIAVSVIKGMRVFISLFSVFKLIRSQGTRILNFSVSFSLFSKGCASLQKPDFLSVLKINDFSSADQFGTAEILFILRIISLTNKTGSDAAARGFPL